MKRHTTMLTTLLLLACLALPGAAAGQEAGQEARITLPPGIKGELILTVTAYDETGARPCFVSPLMIRNPDGSLSDIASLDKLTNQEMAARYLSGVEFLYVDQEGRRRTLKNVRLERGTDTSHSGAWIDYRWNGQGQCEGGIPDERRSSWHLGTISTAGRTDLTPSPDPAARTRLREHSKTAAIAYFAGLFAKYGQTPQGPIADGLKMNAPAFGDLDGDGLEDIAQVWWCVTDNSQGKNPFKHCSLPPGVLVVAFGKGTTASYIPKPQGQAECSALRTPWIMQLQDGRVVVLATSNGRPQVVDILDFSSGAPIRVTRLGRY